MSGSGVHVLILGAGSIGERHLRCFLKTGRARVSFVEIRDELRAEVAGRYPDAQPFSSLEEALQLTYDAAVIATPAPCHVSQAIELLKHDCDLLIEKPLSVTWDGVPELRTAARQSGRTVGLAYVYRANPILADMREALLSGKYGAPVEVIAMCGQNFPTYRPAYRETYYNNRASGGGAIQDALTHVINAVQWMVGPVTRVIADADHQVLEGVDVEDTVHVLARHGKIPACYALNQHQAPNEVTITVVCGQGTLRFEGHHSRWRQMLAPETPWIDSSPCQLERDELFVRQAHAFLDACEGKALVLCPLEEGVASLRVNQALLESLQTQCWQSAEVDLP